jgi:ubiquinone/menaquinone biosynthesis C-methylase UbiE
MNTEHVPLLCDPDTHGPLSLNGDDLVNPETGRRFLIRDGIPVFVENVIGRNLKYQKQYDRLAAIYDSWPRAYTWFFRKWRLQAYLYRELERVPKARVLEVAVGTGWNLRDFASDADLFGLDISWGMLHKCARNFERRRRSVELFQGREESLPFRGEVFDTVFSVGAINFFQDQARAVKEMIRVAKAGTKIVIIGGADKILRAWYYKIPLARKIPAVREYLLDEDMFVRPADLIPPSMRDVEVHELVGGLLYCLSFRKP